VADINGSNRCRADAWRGLPDGGSEPIPDFFVNRLNDHFVDKPHNQQSKFLLI
jgi:hypothetical protein